MSEDVGGEHLTKTEAYAADGTRVGRNLPATGAVRLAIGLVQGLLGYYLFRQYELHAWPATDPYIFAPFVLATLYVPVFVLQALGAMRWRTVAVWAFALVVIVSGLAWYDRYRDATSQRAIDFDPGPVSPPLLVFLFGGLFIAQSLLEAGEMERSYAARYRTYFDAAWKFGLQLALSAAFVAVFWVLVRLGIALFHLTKLEFPAELVKHAWFDIPATTIAFAAAIQLTDVRADVVAGVRTVGLTLLAWLLPLLVFLVGAFVMSLSATGLEPLWETNIAAGILLATAAAIVVLINAGYQDGTSAGPLPGVLRYSEILAAFLLIPLVAISAYALALRVQQYGWTVERIATLGCVLVASCYALGYSGAALFSLLGARWMSSLEGVNIFVAFLILLVLLAFFTPIADPARLAVIGQVSRLKDGQTKPGKFDYLYLLQEGGRYGEIALRELANTKAGPHAAEIRRRANDLLSLKNPPIRHRLEKYSTPDELSARITVYPKGRRLPPSFLYEDWRHKEGPELPCLGFDADKERCDAFFLDAEGNGTEEILLLPRDDDAAGFVAKSEKDGHWRALFSVFLNSCRGNLEALRAGKYRVVTFSRTYRGLEINGHRMWLNRLDDADLADIDRPCPQQYIKIGL